MLLFDAESCKKYLSEVAPIAKDKWSLFYEEGDLVVITPIGKRISFSKLDPCFWNTVPVDQEQSNMLWLYSLGYLPVLIEEFEDFSLSRYVIESLTEFLATEPGLVRINRMTSYDHCIALMIRSLTSCYALNQVLNDSDVAFNKAVNELMEFCLEEAAKPNMVKMNNHGVMLVFSLMHAHLLPDKKISRLAGDGFYKLKLIFDSVFDSQGVCAENSPVYHEFYIKLMAEMITFLVNTGGHDVLDYLVDLKSRAESSLRKIVLPDGSLPPLGDGNLKKTKIKSIPGELYSKDTGFYVRKSKNLYFSIKCGYSSITHKHMDCTSINIWYNNEEIIGDSGVYNYDRKNKYTVLTKSQRGHSGAFFKEYDDFYPGAIFRRDSCRLKSNLAINNERKRGEATAVYDEVNKVIRVFEFVDKRIVIRDSFDSVSNFVGFSRFIIPKESSISFEGSHLVIEKERAELRIGFDYGCKVSIFKSEDSSEIKGFRACKFNTLESSFCVEFYPPDGRFSNSFTIEVKGSEDDEFWGMCDFLSS